ncbi:pyrimidine 5'-nucleotidase [Aestuariibius sp. 2305UL40-4]|uniref:pyrimidine 5'-nucleotidase n=1 Tax=Aestuariibius violaceus TaxID=3234132 RepID=UPI00345E191A
MPRTAFAPIRHWVFDLDNTLYTPDARLFDQIEERMADWIMESLDLGRQDAHALRRTYWQRYGTTLAGLMAEHRIDPDGFLDHVHDIDLAALAPDPGLRRAIDALPGRRIVFTNGSRGHAARILAARGLTDLFEAIYGVEDADYVPKPQRAAFDAIFDSDNLTPDRSAMFEDDIRNLETPFALGLRTVHVAGEPDPAPHIHHHTDDLAGFLSQIV